MKKKKKQQARFYIKMKFSKVTNSVMELCNLCGNKYSKLFKPEEKLLGTQLSSIIEFIFGGYQVDFPPKFLICTACAAALLQAEIVLKHLSNALPGINNFHDDRTSSHTEKDENNDEQSGHEGDRLDRTTNEEPSKFVSVSKKSLDWMFHCTHCEYETNVVKLYKQHLISKHQEDDQRIYKCMHCDQAYQRVNGIHNHIATAHGNKLRPMPQRRQTIAFDTPPLLSSTTIKSQLENDTTVINTKIEHNPADGANLAYEFECAQCKYTTVNPKLFKKHQYKKHQVEDTRIYKCKQCPSTYVRQFALQNHIAYTHENKPRPKPQRRKSVGPDLELNTTSVKESQIPVPKLEQEEQDLNGEVGNQKGDILSNATDDEHQNEQEHIFQKPQKRKRYQLNSNEISNSDWVFQCMLCGFETEKKIKYRAHLNNEHGVFDRDVYKCLHCSASYERYSLLQSHMTNKHSINMTAMDDSPAIYSDSSKDHIKLQSAKKRKVEKSKLITSCQDNLKGNGSQTQQKDSCVVCGKKYTSVEKLRAHMDNRHGGDEIKHCPNCDAQFRSLEKYEAHMFGEKCLDTKMACQYPGCPKRFSKFSKMQKHMREKHPEILS